MASVPAFAPSRIATISRRSALSRSTLLLQVRSDDSFHWLPGQHIRLAPPGAPELAASYSIASAPDPSFPGQFELAMSLSATPELLAGLVPGRTLLVSEPRGAFVWEPAPGAALLLGIGTGIAPLRAMLQAALRTAPVAPVGLLLGARTEEDVLFHDELARLAERQPLFRFEPTLSRASEAWTGARGRVQDHLPRVVAAIDAARFFVCGTKTMVDESVACLGRLGIDHTRILSESHGA